MFSAEGEEDQRQTSTKSEKCTNNLLDETGGYQLSVEKRRAKSKIGEGETYAWDPRLTRGQIMMRQIQNRHKDDREPNTATPIPMYSALDFVVSHHFTRSG